MTMHDEVITEALNRQDGACYCGDPNMRCKRVNFVYTDMSQEEWSSRFDCLVPKTIRKVCPDLLAFTQGLADHRSGAILRTT